MGKYLDILDRTCDIRDKSDKRCAPAPAPPTFCRLYRFGRTFAELSLELVAKLQSPRRNRWTLTRMLP